MEKRNLVYAFLIIFLIIFIASQLKPPEKVYIFTELRGRSMEPCLFSGDEIRVTKVDSPEDIELDDVVVFYAPETEELIAHVLILKDVDEDMYLTRGYATKIFEKIIFEQIKGVVVTEEGEKFRC